MFYAVLDRETKTCRYVSTGHPPPIHLTAEGGLNVLDSSGLPIGIFQPGEAGYEPYDERSIQLKRGDRFCIYSDGIVESRNPSNQEFGLDGLSRVLKETRNKSLDDCFGTVLAAASDWRNGAAPSDDLSILGLDVC
jgi:sigma-B regulation protein RsbU (phosphoserine phosphatase)